MPKTAPPLCGCADRSGYVPALYKCKHCGNVCKYCREYCIKVGHKVRKLTPAEIGTPEDWIKAFGYPS